MRGKSAKAKQIWALASKIINYRVGRVVCEPHSANPRMPLIISSKLIPSGVHRVPRRLSSTLCFSSNNRDDGGRNRRLLSFPHKIRKENHLANMVTIDSSSRPERIFTKPPRDNLQHTTPTTTTTATTSIPTPTITPTPTMQLSWTRSNSPSPSPSPSPSISSFICSRPTIIAITKTSTTTKYNHSQSRRIHTTTPLNYPGRRRKRRSNKRPIALAIADPALPLSESILDSIAKEAKSIFDRSSPPPHEQETREALLLRLQRIVSFHLSNGNPKLQMFGSSLNNTGLAGADVDICLTIDDDKYPLVSPLVWKLRGILLKSGMEQVFALPRARVPIVKFKDPTSQLCCDICINNHVALHNTRLIVDYSLIDPRMRILAILVKYWAKKRGLNKTQHGTLSSYAYVNLVIFYLQNCTPPVLPSLQQLAEKFPNRLIVDEHDCTYYTDIDSLYGFGHQNKESVAEHIFGFYQYYTHFDFDHEVVSIRQGKSPTKKKGVGFFVEDPFEIYRNLGKQCIFSLIRSEFQQAYTVIANSGSFESACNLPHSHLREKQPERLRKK